MQGRMGGMKFCWLKRVWPIAKHRISLRSSNPRLEYEQFSDEGRKVMQFANQEAQRLNHEYIGTEHILLGLIKEGSCVLVFKSFGIELWKVRADIESIIRRGPNVVAMGKLPPTPRARNVIEYAMEEARNLNHNYVDTEHILLGLLREQEGVGGVVLTNFGLTMEKARREVIQILSGRGPATNTY